VSEQESAESAFEQLVGQLDYPMFVVTTRGADRLSGCLVGFASQAGITPSRFFVGLSRRNHTFGVAGDAEYLAVHVLAREHLGLARLFGSETGDEVDKFERCRWHEGPHRLPILDDAAAWFVGRIIRRIDAGDHVGVLLEPFDGEMTSAATGELVSFSDVKDLDPGHDA
jgi:flavin reductase (DIM6/NTAB) family NADH-FMN oxidoreductase RutF